MKTSTVLRRALRLLGENGERWIKGSYAKDKFSGPISWCDRRASLFCAVGALRKSAPDSIKAELTLGYFLRSGSVSEWNDRARSFATIRRGFERAIALAEKEEKSYLRR